METLNENEELKPKSEETSGDLASWVQGAVNHADKEFPLSGNETNEDLIAPLQDEEERKNFLDDLDTQFPLSGGETDEDLKD